MNNQDFSQICRTCSSVSNEMQSIFKTNELLQNITFASLVMNFTSLQVKKQQYLMCRYYKFSFQIVENDGLPSLICDRCVKLAVQIYQFKQQCESVNNKLQFYLKNNVKTENIFPECIIETKELSVDVFENDSIDGAETIKSDEIKCVICNRLFLNEQGLKRHMSLHQENKLSCPVCSKTFSRAFDVRRHMTRHTGEKPFSCDYCDKSFTQSGTLMQHLRTHKDIPIVEKKKRRPGEKVHLCNICGKSFKDASCLTVHIRRHTGEKPYQCQHCHMRYKQLLFNSV